MSTDHDPSQQRPDASTGGVDWAKDDHAVCDRRPRRRAGSDRFTVTHDAAGLQDPGPAAAHGRRRPRSAIERPDGPVVDALLQAGLTVFVIPPGQLKNLRSPLRLGRQQGRPVRRLRAGRRRAHRPAPAAPAAASTPRPPPRCASSVRARRDLVAHRVAVANQLRAHLQIVFPAAVGLFADIDSEISLRFLERFTTQDQADWLSHPKRLAAWLARSATAAAPTPQPARAPDAPPPRRHRPGRADPRRDHRRVRRRAAHPHHPDRGPGRPHRRTARRCTPTAHDLHQPAPLRAPSAPPACSPRSATPAAASPPPTPWPAWPASPPPPASPARSKPSASAGAPTNNSATRSATSPATPATPTPGPPTSTNAPAPAATTTPTPSASWPAPGSTSSGAAGTTNSPTTPPTTAPSNASSTKINRRRLDTGQLTGCPGRPCGGRRRGTRR